MFRKIKKGEVRITLDLPLNSIMFEHRGGVSYLSIGDIYYGLTPNELKDLLLKIEEGKVNEELTNISLIRQLEPKKTR